MPIRPVKTASPLLSCVSLIFLMLLLYACSEADVQAPNPTATSPGATLPAEVNLTAEPTSTPLPTQPPTLTHTPLPTSTPEPTATFTPTPLPTLILDTFEVPMVLVPAGEFVMGSDTNMAAARPAHTVYLDTFYIDQFEVTNALYLECAEAGVCTTGGSTRLHNPVFAEHPVMNVTWYEAQKYCEWREASLPSEAQWEKAARGTDERTFPWGNEPVTCERARYGDCGWFTVPVGQHPTGVSPYGAHDMAGNAWEWVYDWYDEDYYTYSPAENPTGPESGTWKTERGGAWFYHADLQTAIWRNQAPVTATYAYVGFRCARLP